MLSLALVVIAGVELFCVGLLWVRKARAARTVILGLVGIGTAYDSAVFGLGALIGEGPLLHGLSVGRFVGHALLTPLLVLWAADRTKASPRWRRVAAVITILLIGWGLLSELAHLQLAPRWFADTLRYTSESSTVPLAAIAVSAVLVVAGVALWREEGIRFPLVGVAALIVASGAGAVCPPLGNAGEAVMLVALTGAELAAPGLSSNGRRDRHQARVTPAHW